MKPKPGTEQRAAERSDDARARTAAAKRGQSERSETEAEPALWSSRRRLLKCWYRMLISNHDVVGYQEHEFHRHRHC